MSGWVRVENTMPENIKIAPISDRGFRLWMHAVCYCSRAQTDGLVPAALACSLSLTATKRIVEELVEAGLFEPVAGGYRVHDYLNHNPSRARISELREAAKTRTARWRDGASDENVTRHDDDAVTHHVRSPAHARDLPSPTRSEEEEAFDYWQRRCQKTRAKFTRERRQKLRARFAEKYTLEDVKRGVDGAAANPPRDRDSGVVYDDLVSICRNGAQLERYIERAAPALRVVGSAAKESPSDLLRAIWAEDEPEAPRVVDADVVEGGV